MEIASLGLLDPTRGWGTLVPPVGLLALIPRERAALVSYQDLALNACFSLVFAWCPFSFSSIILSFAMLRPWQLWSRYLMPFIFPPAASCPSLVPGPTQVFLLCVACSEHFLSTSHPGPESSPSLPLDSLRVSRGVLLKLNGKIKYTGTSDVLRFLQEIRPKHVITCV